MGRTLLDLLAVVKAELGFAVLLGPPGYLLGMALDLQGFRRMRLPLRLAWAVALSVPCAILLSVFCGRHLRQGQTTAVLVSVAAVAAGVMAWQVVRGRFTRWDEWDRAARWTAVAMVLLAGYCMLATLGITVGHRLYEGVYSADWGVRIPLTAAAIDGGVPIMTPFYGLDGQATPLRYYYYWYAVCGAVGRLTHEPAHAVLSASSAWSAVALFAVLFLLMRYLFGSSGKSGQVRGRRWMYLLMLPVSCVLGLDVLPALVGLMVRPIKLTPELEWWRSQGDFSMSFHTAVLYAPHHTMGLVCSLLGCMMQTRCARRGAEAVGWRGLLVSAAVAAVCFAAAIGTSTYLVVVFALACVALAAERAVARDWGVWVPLLWRGCWRCR